jgi:hypothetical protein
MPLPNPKKKEKQGDFISRCAGDKTTNKDFPDTKQRVAVCYSQWKKAKASAMASFGEGYNEVLFECPECVKAVETTKLAASEESLDEYKNEFIEMALGSITVIADHAKEILDNVNDPKVKENLSEPFLQKQIALAEDYMMTISNYVMYSKESDQETDLTQPNTNLE